MSTFAIIMLAGTAFFAYQIYRHVNTLEDQKEEKSEPIIAPVESKPVNTSTALIDEADEAYSEGDLERALDKLTKANVLLPNNPEILNKVAFIHGKLGNTQSAIEWYKHSLELDDADDLTHNAIASIYKTEGSLLLAKEHYEKALQIDDAYSVTYYNYANLLADMGEMNQAKELYTRALELQEDFPEARAALDSLKGNE
ncbi:MAG: tetratricopeptide repeat protein [Sulfuricurvum sp.]|nr:tetratricopeptide repeat protein [Sulfuricurvum sp.]